MFDPEGIHRAVLNVVTNAIDACDEIENGEVRVQTVYDREAKLLKVIVADTGQGVAPEEMNKLFTLFTSTKGGRGTGLGLSVSQKICKEHGGVIRVKSKPGEGSEFILELPATGSDDQQNAALPGAAKAANSEIRPVATDSDSSIHETRVS